MRSPQDLHDYQRECILHQLQHNDSMLWLQMGLGKTVVTLTTIVDRMRAGQVKKTLVFGPLRVINSVWNREAIKWSHTQHLRFSIVRGSPEKRVRRLFNNADIFLINYENMNWLADTFNHYYISQGKPLPFDMVVYDEVSKLKHSGSLRVAGGKRDRKDRSGRIHEVKITGWRKMINQFKYRTGLTGTPASNGYLDLHGQYLAVDGGQRLGEYITHYKNSYFIQDYNGWKYTPTKLGKEWIEHKIFDITKKMDAADYLDMPEVKVINMMIDMPPKARKHYEEIEKKMFTALDSGREIELFAKQTISNKCLQICNGAPYLSPFSKEWEEVHTAKLEALEEVMEEAAGQPVLCAYSFQSDAERITKRFGKKYRVVNLTATSSAKTQQVIDDWNAGKIDMMLGHPASMGHGVDGLQESGSIAVWFGVTNNLEYYEQLNGRLARQGQTNAVSVIRILCRDTMDLVSADAINRKTDDQEGLKEAVDRYRKGLISNDLPLTFI